ncbi:adenine phosphoribosyltransferase [Spiroplasma endosymbiont of Danaus chrysippus]|uniref:adenine phosphoribosyltransferase n=1 Tax=Spiroplasma endosymbiont of Danaus chrysippus TaxID=2691041 RepID=UPI00157A2DFB|nr:adenine phosphoribosyltransferase [Spiroplasma endosymbiont of Danaus chrysippus]
MTKESLKKIIINIPDFPIKGIQFKDINPILSNPEAFQSVVNIFVDFIKKCGATAILAPEARGFIFGTAIAYKLGIKLVLARKKDKLPGKTYKVTYDLEYGTAILEMQQNVLSTKDKVVIIDDLIATSGTINACLNLIKQSNAQSVGIATLISLSEFANKHHFDNIPLLEIIQF